LTIHNHGCDQEGSHSLCINQNSEQFSDCGGQIVPDFYIFGSVLVAFGGKNRQPSEFASQQKGEERPFRTSKSNSATNPLGSTFCLHHTVCALLQGVFFGGMFSRPETHGVIVHRHDDERKLTQA
jgi:hypothetical protein